MPSLYYEIHSPAVMQTRQAGFNLKQPLLSAEVCECEMSNFGHIDIWLIRK